MSIFFKTNKNNPILNRLVSDNCLSFGRSPKLNNRKITHYISGTRQKVDIFNFYEMRYLLLKVYPLIHNLFLQQRLNVKKKKRILFEKKINFQTTSQKLPKQFRKWEDFRNFKTKFNKPLSVALRPLLPKILFATTTEIYSSIVASAAKKCHMPFHVNRWLSGTITASASYLDDLKKWSFLTSDLHKDMHSAIQQQFFKRKKNIAQQAYQTRKYQLGRKPSLIIIPDVSNNEMIIKETNAFGIPVLGIVSSNCNTEIAYPIFANDFSVYSIHFFCHFLSSLITKEIVKNKHKLYIAPKRKIGLQFSQAIKDIVNFNSRVSKLKTCKKKRKPGAQYSFKGRYFLDSLVKPKIKIKKNLKYAKSPQFRNKLKNFLISPKKLILVEDQKRLKKTRNLYYLKKKGLKKPKKRYYLKNRVLPRIKLIKKLHHFNFSKIVREIRVPANKPKFRFWNQSKFFFSNTLQFVKNTSLAFQFKRFVFPKLLKKRFWNEKRLEELKNPKRKYKNYKHKNYKHKKIYKSYKNFNIKKKQYLKNNKKKLIPYRKRWAFEKTKSTNDWKKKKN